MKIVVVGAGIIGASIAWHLRREGAEVLVIDSGRPAASTASFGWINASFYVDTAHHRLRVASMAAYGRLMTVLDLPILQSGALCWEAQGADLRNIKTDLQALDYPLEYLKGQALHTAEPDLANLPDEALLFPSEGAADPAGVAATLLAASGARVLRGVAVHEVRGDDTVAGVRTDMGDIDADRVVVAAGNGTAALLASTGVTLPMLERPGALVTTKPFSAKIDHILVTPDGEARQLPDGRILASAVASHQGDDAAYITDHPEQIAGRVLGWLQPLIPNEVLEWDNVSLAYRPMPADGLPVIGPVGPKGLHVAVMHSGVTLAAIAGEATAAEVLGHGHNRYADLLAPYRPDRFP
ncbi:FAD-binding oxidoreductase [Octadecabacter sp.]|nr:FAD-binding oxidoreductase [Octadecabacter sp.]